MAGKDFYAHFSSLPDEALRAAFNDALDRPSSVEGPYDRQWRTWLLGFLLEYFSARPLQSITDQSRCAAFALRFLAPIAAGLSGPVRIEQVLFVLEKRPEIVSALLFGSQENRRAALQTAYDTGSGFPAQELLPFQQDILNVFVERFDERPFDPSTIAKWSRDLIPELESAVLEHFKPARRMAQGEMIQKMVSSQPVGGGSSDRARLLGLVEKFEHGPLSIHYAYALSALNDYDRRVDNQRSYFVALKRGLTLSGLLTAAFVVLLSLNRPSADALRVVLVLVGLLAAPLIVVTLIMIWSALITASEHVTRTRMDIQTLQQLAERV